MRWAPRRPDAKPGESTWETGEASLTLLELLNLLYQTGDFVQKLLEAFLGPRHAQHAYRSCSSWENGGLRSMLSSRMANSCGLGTSAIPLATIPLKEGITIETITQINNRISREIDER